MKPSLLSLMLPASLALLTVDAHAMHAYASYDCAAGKLALRYDGPGSNYAVGGYSHFYLKGQKNGLLAYEASGSDADEIGSEVGDSGKLEVTFDTVHTRTIGKPVVQPGGDECGSYDHTDSKTVRTIKITAISEAAAKKLGLKAGSMLRMACKETEDMPSGDCSK